MLMKVIEPHIELLAYLSIFTTVAVKITARKYSPRTV